MNTWIQIPIFNINQCAINTIPTNRWFLIKADIEAAGGKVTGSVSAKTNYLVCNAVENTTKYNKALQLNIPIITEVELMEMING